MFCQHCPIFIDTCRGNGDAQRIPHFVIEQGLWTKFHLLRIGADLSRDVIQIWCEDDGRAREWCIGTYRDPLGTFFSCKIEYFPNVLHGRPQLEGFELIRESSPALGS